MVIEVLYKSFRYEKFDSSAQTNSEPFRAKGTNILTDWNLYLGALEENGISEIVETSYGYHIIKRLPLDDEDIESSDKFSELAYADLDEFFTDKIANTEFVEKEGYAEMVKPILDEGEAYLADLLTQQQAAGSDNSADDSADAE